AKNFIVDLGRKSFENGSDEVCDKVFDKGKANALPNGSNSKAERARLIPFFSAALSCALWVSIETQPEGLSESSRRSQQRGDLR
ncbi:MAG: hypothetical protein AB1813_28335, partial [Verrucomicrobiota bacterium]